MLKIAVDLGTSVTKIYKTGSGIVLSEPTCVAVDSATRAVKAIGEDAKLLVGKTAEGTSVVFPVFEGEVTDQEMAAAMLDVFLEKIGIRAGRGRVDAVFSIPCGAPEKVKSAVYSVCDRVGLSHVGFVETPFLSAIGQDLPISDSNPVFVMDIGAGVTNIGVMSLDGIIAGVSVNIGGSNMDAHIADYVSEHFGLKIGPLTSERLKNTVGSLIAGDSHSMVVNGRDIAGGRPRSIAVNSADIVYPIQVYIDKLIEYAGMILKKLPAEVSAGICKSGIHLSGGVGKIAGLANYIAGQIGIETHLCEEPAMAVVLGAGRAIGNSAVIRKIRSV